jgi:hypothetical protein
MIVSYFFQLCFTNELGALIYNGVRTYKVGHMSLSMTTRKESRIENRKKTHNNLHNYFKTLRFKWSSSDSDDNVPLYTFVYSYKIVLYS